LKGSSFDFVDFDGFDFLDDLRAGSSTASCALAFLLWEESCIRGAGGLEVRSTIMGLALDLVDSTDCLDVLEILDWKVLGLSLRLSF
jgi:hypothetical protein